MALPDIRVVLTRPKYGGNIGSVCRAMMNMGLSKLVLVDPAPEITDLDVRRYALRAEPLWLARTVHPTLMEAVADCATVVATTAREGLYRESVLNPRELAAFLLPESDNAPAALVFGPEDHGLSNDELKIATHIAQIPSTPEFSSLNLSQAVLILAYELYVASGTHIPRKERSDDAPLELRERMLTVLEQGLLKIGFMKEDKADHMMFGIRRILSRGRLSINDVKILMGVARQITWAGDRARDRGEIPPAAAPES